MQTQASAVLEIDSRHPDRSRFSKVRYLVISDIHLGNQRNPAWRIVDNLLAFFDNFTDESQFTKLDIIFIDGDFFDKALWFSSDDVSVVMGFIVKLFDFCERHSIRLRYVEGTPSHDRRQFRNYIPLSRKYPLLDFKYIGDMCVEGFYDLGITCLYVPDEHEHGGEKSQDVIDKHLKSLGIDKVDICMVHSWFKYQVPEVASTSKYDEQFFLDRVHYFISNGHIHGPSTYDRIIGQGSFDRIAHNEEHPKGAVLIEITPEEQCWFFVENKNALPFVTLHIKATTTVDKALTEIDRIAKELPEYAWLRIKASESHPVMSSISQLQKQYQHIRLEKITEQEEAKKKQRLVDQTAFEAADYVAVNIDKTNIIRLTLEEMEASQMEHDFIWLEQHMARLL